MQTATEIARENVPTVCAVSPAGLIPTILQAQCKRLIESYHDIHGYSCLPDMLWRSGLRQFIEQSPELHAVLRKASKTRKAKTSNDGFVSIATTIIAMEVLTSGFAKWDLIYPDAACWSRKNMPKRTTSSSTPLMDHYLYPPKYLDFAAIKALTPPLTTDTTATEVTPPSAPAVLRHAKDSAFLSQMFMQQA